MRWEQTTLPTKAEPGYGERELSAEKFVLQSPEPTLVWFVSMEDEDANRSLEATVFQNEQVGLTLKRFRCVKIDVESIRDRELREQYGRSTPSFHVIDPAGETIATLEGKRADSLSRFDGMMEHAWRKMFTVRHRDFLRDMKKILDRLDRVTAQQTVLASKRQRVEESGNRRKLAALEREAAELAAEQAVIEKDEQEILARCELREEYREPSEDVASAR